MKKKSTYDGGLNYNMLLSLPVFRFNIGARLSKSLFGRQVNDMKKKSTYDGGLNYNMLKPTCPYIKLTETDKEHLSGRQIKDMTNN